ncbi:RNA-binding protein S1 [Paenalkalicoccus suaedae]|uniref:RNA-binding protein S1 n=1 Tax=Paenalkalicoccus suaedae TaxID=2592382 RepID=A0A859F9W5_9BACI|nr:S1 domain-containing RNA-binding protein [Paenalkalicoccus suaedae]QKS69650.1 RNA-binding protein S1 [Paenalkalicoccus suaedae]
MAIETGSKVTGKVTGITKFGAFVELPEGKTGLVHISEVSHSYVKEVSDHLTVGDEVTVKIVKVGDDGKIALSIRQTQDAPPKPTRESAPRRPQPKKRPESPASFEDKMNKFLRDSEERLSTLRTQTDGKRKRGGGGSRGNDR